MNTIDIKTLALELKDAQDALFHAKKLENKLRQQLATAINLESLRIGVNNIDEGDLRIKAVRKITHSVDRIALDEIWGDLTDEEKEAIDFKPSLKLKVYKTIEHGRLDDAIEVKPAMPSITVSLLGE